MPAGMLKSEHILFESVISIMPSGENTKINGTKTVLSLLIISVLLYSVCFAGIEPQLRSLRADVMTKDYAVTYILFYLNTLLANIAAFFGFGVVMYCGARGMKGAGALCAAAAFFGCLLYAGGGILSIYFEHTSMSGTQIWAYILGVLPWLAAEAVKLAAVYLIAVFVPHIHGCRADYSRAAARTDLHLAALLSALSVFVVNIVYDIFTNSFGNAADIPYIIAEYLIYLLYALINYFVIILVGRFYTAKLEGGTHTPPKAA